MAAFVLESLRQIFSDMVIVFCVMCGVI